jgi:hypothetical protein
MRDLLAGIVAIVLLVVAVSLASTLTLYRRRRQRARDSERALGRTIVAELPVSEELVLFSEDRVRFYYGERSLDKDLIESATLLINGVPIARAVSHRRTGKPSERVAGESEAEAVGKTAAFEDKPEGIVRDRWDVALETVTGTVMVECGAIRERVSQELARAIFDAVKHDIERRNDAMRRSSGSGRAT